jgi:hypothetical protein
VREGYQFRAFGKKLLKVIKLEATVIVNVQHSNSYIGPLGGQLPRHETRIVVGHRDDDFVASSEIGIPPGRRDEIDRFGCSARPYDLLRAACIQCVRNCSSCFLVQIRTTARQGVERFRWICIVVQVEARECVSDRAGSLRSGRAVKVNQGMPVYTLLQGWEMRAQ